MKTKVLKDCWFFSIGLLLTETVLLNLFRWAVKKALKYFPVSVTSYISGKEDGTIVCWLDKSGNGCLKIQKLSPSGITEWGNNGRCVCKNLNLQFSSNTDYLQYFQIIPVGQLLFTDRYILILKRFILQKYLQTEN